MATIKSDRPGIRLWIDNQDLTHHLGDLGAVRARKSLYAPMGEVHINFPDLPTQQRDSLYGVIPVMAPLRVEIKRDGGEWAPILRGFVRAVGRSEQVSGDGRVQRMVTVTAHDCGAAFIMENIHKYNSWQNQGAAYPRQVAWFMDWVSNKNSELYSPGLAVDQFIKAVAVGSTDGILKAAGYQWGAPLITVTKGYVLPHAVQSNDGPVWEILSRYSDPPWNELFVREGKDNPELVFRPTPWVTAEGEVLASLIGESIRIDDPIPIRMGDVLSLNAMRDDAEVTNHIWIESPAAQTMGLVQATDLPGGIVRPDTREQFGDRRPSSLATQLLPTDDATDPSRDRDAMWMDFKGWILGRRNWALKANALNHQTERGTLVIRGNPAIRVGDYIQVQRGGQALAWYAYVTEVSHDYQPFRRYVTQVAYIRGTQWLKRQQMPQGAWDKERITDAL